MDECLVYSPRLCVFLQMHIESIWYGMKENGSITIKDYRYSRDVVLCCVVLCCVVLCCVVEVYLGCVNVYVDGVYVYRHSKYR